jgi:putative transposase
MAIAQRRPNGVIVHSDQGSQYTSLAFGQRCREFNVTRSMGSVGDAYDNAMTESFFATLECELLDRSSFRTPAEARRASSSSSKVGTTPNVTTRRCSTARRSRSSERRS